MFRVPLRNISAIKAVLNKQYAFCKFRLGPPCFKAVSTWSPLGNAFNTKSKPHFFTHKLTGRSTGLFGFQELLTENGFILLKENVENSCDYLVGEATSPNRQRKMVEIFDELSDTLCKVADMAEFVRTGHPEKSYAMAAEYACLDINGLVEQLNTNHELYQALKTVVEQGDICETDEVDKHVAKLFLFDFEQSGIHLDQEKREKVVELNEYILQIGSHFVHNTSLPRSIQKKDLPLHLSQCVAGLGETVESGNLFADSKNELYRELSYRTFLQPDSHQTELLERLLSARHTLAKLCGFPSYAHRALNGSLANNPEFVMDFLTLLSKDIHPMAAKDYEQMLKMKRDDISTSTELYPWDVPYYTSAFKQQKYQISSKDYSCYFSLGACMEGLSNLFSALYGVVLKVEQPCLGEIWHEDIIKLAVYEGNATLGYIYCDFFERPGKPSQDCHFTIRGGKTLPDGSNQMPVVTLFLTLPNPKWNCPSLLTPSLMDNLFHEMGHAMHSILGRTKYQHVTGTRCPTDFAEVPSILMEYFSSDPRVVSSFARHYATGEPIPERLLCNLRDSKRIFCASETQLQVFYASLDQSLHSSHSLGKTSLDVLRETQNKHYGLPHVSDTAWHLRFGHLVGYGAKYYAYLVSRAVASSIWYQYFQKDPFCSHAGQQYRDQVLAHGGGKPPRQLVESYLGTEATPQNLVKGLMLDLKN